MSKILEDIEISIARVETEATAQGALDRVLELGRTFEQRGLMKQAGACELAACDIERALIRLEDFCR